MWWNCTGTPSHENDKIGTNKWPQFVQDDVEHDNTYMLWMNSFVYAAETA